MALGKAVNLGQPTPQTAARQSAPPENSDPSRLKPRFLGRCRRLNLCLRLRQHGPAAPQRARREACRDKDKSPVPQALSPRLVAIRTSRPRHTSAVLFERPKQLFPFKLTKQLLALLSKSRNGLYCSILRCVVYGAHPTINQQRSRRRLLLTQLWRWRVTYYASKDV